MTIVSYNGSKLIPAPFVSVNKDYQTATDGTKVGSQFNITISGTIVGHRGSPNTSGVFHTTSGEPADEVVDDNAKLAAIIRKQEAIRQLFSEDGHSLEFQSADGSQPMKCNPRIVSISFAEGQWYHTSQYTIVCEADVLSVNGQAVGEDDFSEYISSASESWSIETSEDTPEGISKPRTYRLTHTLQAQGKRFYDDTGNLEKAAWQQARDWVSPRLGIDNAFLSSDAVEDLPNTHLGFNHVRSENIDEIGGNYSVTETWLLASGSALEDFTVSIRTSAETGITTVSIEGNVIGLEERDSSMSLVRSKYDNAVTKYASVSSLALTRAQSYSGITLNITPLATTVARNPVTGTINYTFEYDSRPSNILTFAKSEVISVTDSWDIDVFAAIPVLGRIQGPVLQPIDTHQALVRSLNVEIVIEPPTGSIVNRFKTQHPRFNPTTLAELQDLVDAINPTTAFSATQVYVSNQNETWEPKGGRYSYSVEWTYEV